VYQLHLTVLLSKYPELRVYAAIVLLLVRLTHSGWRDLRIGRRVM
jgi:hypothetical protein